MQIFKLIELAFADRIFVVTNIDKVLLSKYFPNNVEFFNADATEFNYEKIDKVSKVTLSNVLEHIEKRTSFLKKLIDAFEDKDIKFLIRVPLITRDWLPVYKKKLNLEYRLDKTHFIEYDLETFKKEILESDLKITSLSIH